MPSHFIHQHLGVGLMAQDGADGLGDVGGREHGQRHLVKQRLKRLMIAAVDTVTSTGKCASPLAALRPAKPPPTITTRGRRVGHLLVVGRMRIHAMKDLTIAL